MYFFRFTAGILSKTYHILTSRKQEQKWATHYVKQLEQQLGGQLDDFTFKKVVTSYAIYIPMMCDAFTLLRNRLTNNQEKERMLHYFICSSLFDNFCDRAELTADELYSISFEPEVYQPRTFDEKLFLHSHRLLQAYVKDKTFYSEVTRQLYKAQEDSALQFDKTVSNDVIAQITLDKGGYSVLLCHFYLDEQASPAEKHCWYQIGGIIQLTNDLYDIYKDIQEGSETLPNRMTDAHAFNHYFLGLVQNIKQEIAALPFSSKQKQAFTISMMGICSLGSMALRQLMQLQGTAAILPPFSSLPRKALIIDMEKPANLWYCIKTVYQQAK
ncbi:hypothetical protein [Chitinophaga defluvii]|uniref:Uncharacterized protein n=1 Tax=Chitinophaga defluvii TaxID=3163343 RepID=A0ABV2T3F7_9BACT